MKFFKLIVVLLLAVQIFATPFAKLCEMNNTETISCCISDCNCDDDIPQQIDLIKQQVKYEASGFLFDYQYHSFLELIVCLDKDEQSSRLDTNDFFIHDSQSKLRARLQVFLI